MVRFIVFVLALCASAVGGGWVTYRHYLSEEPAVVVVTHESQGPTIEEVRELSDLVVLDVPISDVHVSTLDGLTGSMKMVVAVRGDVQIATDLGSARFEDRNEEEKIAIVVVSKPRVQRPRVDHERTRVVEISRSGMWRILGGGAGEDVLTELAFSDAQKVLGEAAKDPELIAMACGRTERVLRGFFESVGWTVRVQWEDGATASAM